MLQHRLSWISLFLVSNFALSVRAEEKNILATEEKSVRVRLWSEADEFVVSGVGLQFQDVDSKYQPVSIPQRKTARISVLRKDKKKIWSIRWDSQSVAQLSAKPYLFIKGQNLTSQSKPLPSKILLSQNAEGLDVVGVVPLEDYVVGVIAGEMPLSWPIESLKAQAVAARSYAMAVMRERRNSAWQLESSVLDQVFRPLAKQDDNELIKKARRAVEDTRGVELRSPSGKAVLKAFYHSDCGGRTTLAKNVWTGSVNTGVATDSSCPTSPKSQWTLRVPAQELMKKVGLEISQMKLIRPAAGERVSQVLLALNDGQKKAVSANDFRQRLGFQELKSTQFDVSLDKNGDYVFKGRGFGHGVGLCQWGSRALGQKGWGFKEILKHYYPLAHLQGVTELATH